MIDIKFIRDNPDIVRAALKNKNREGAVDLDEVLKLYEERRTLRQQLDEISKKRNEAATARDIEAGKKLKEEFSDVSAKHGEIEKQFIALMVKIPNIPSPDTPIAEDEKGNLAIRQVGEKPKFDFEPKAHWDLGRELGVINDEKAGDVSGARFAYLMGDLAMMQFALLQLAFKILTNEETLKKIAERAGLNVSTKPFIPVVPPYMMRSAVMNRMARLDPIEERYYYEKDDLVLIGSAEHTLGPLHMDEVLQESDLPIRYVGYSPAFRREAGSYGKDTRGITRMHHFDKVEMETFVKPEDGYKEQDFIVAIQEYYIQQLELPYQAVLISTGDMGFADQRQFDMETWMPGQKTYRETHTSDYMGGFQARRLNTRVKRESGENDFVHMNDATLVAMGRTLAAILENNQQADGSVKVPKVLQEYMSKDIIKG
jgi:seryl-tRNA synthetase